MRADLVDFMGTDLSVVNAARVSFAKESLEFSADDERLIKFLARNNHWSPFAHTAVTLRMQAPVPIRTQCFKHKQGFVENEESRRYISSEPEVFFPEVWRKAPEGSVKQGSSSEPVEYMVFNWGDGTRSSERIDKMYCSATSSCVSLYRDMIEAGVCPEQARFVLPQGCLVNWIWTGNVYSFANFYNKRTDDHAQREVQELAQKVGEIIRPLFPVSWEALTQGSEA